MNVTNGLTTSELAQIRADCNELLPDTGYILTVTRASDSAGGWTESSGTAGTISCRLDFQKPYGKETLANASLTPFKNGVLSMPYDTVITTDNQVSTNGVIYNVTGVNDSQSWIGIKRCSVERVP
jgi:hypothetical protein